MSKLLHMTQSRDQWKQAFIEQETQLQNLLRALADMKHDLDLFYSKYREPDNKYIANLRAAITEANQ